MAGTLIAYESGAADFRVGMDAVRQYALKGQATHYSDTGDGGGYVFRVVRGGVDRQRIYFAHGKFHVSKTVTRLQRLPKDAVPVATTAPGSHALNEHACEDGCACEGMTSYI